MSGLGISEISAVVPTNFKRQKELEQVVDFLREAGFGEVVLAYGDKRMYNRYERAKEAKYDVIYTQDDDCIIRNIDMLVRSYEPGKIIANAKLAHLDYYARASNSKVCLVGFGAIFDKSLIDNFDRYLKKYKEDDVLYREADRAFTWLNEKELLLADESIEDFPVAMEGMSMDSDHYTSMHIMLDRLRRL